MLDITDVLGKRVVETTYAGRVTVREENAAAALEVMSRFALDPRWLMYLPPTMSPVATATHAGVLEHPDEAFSAFRSDGVGQVLCQEKHMGSRAVVLVCRDLPAARARFGAPGDATGAIYTRTGRSFFKGSLTEDLLAMIREAAESIGLYDELGASWLLFDAELLPWSAKAEDLLRNQYAAVGAAATAALPVAVSTVEAAAARGLDVGALLSRTLARSANATAFVTSYRRYCWPTDGLEGVRIAPFQLLASDGATYHDKPHDWHLAISDRLVAADPETFQPTRRLAVDTTDAASTAAATRWWEELTAAGGEGMVVKPPTCPAARRASCSPGSRCVGASICGSSTGPTTRSRTISRGCSRAASATSGRWRSGSMRSVSSHWSARRAASRCGVCTSASSPCSHWSPSRWTRGCELGLS